MAKIGDIVVYQTQDGDLRRDAAVSPGEQYENTAAIVTSIGPNDTLGLVVFLDSAVTPLAFHAHGWGFSIGGVDHGDKPNGWRTQDEAAKVWNP